jgi:RimJ/RimL family protein N-acetyltransferase
MRRAVGNYELDDDPARIDPAAAAAFLTTEAYWGRWRTEHDIRRQIATAWQVIGAYDAAGAMVGLARAISDGGSAYLADVYVLPAHRGRGLGKAVVAMMVEEGPGAGFRWMLHTSDAYGLYRQFGFGRRRTTTWNGPRAVTGLIVGPTRWPHRPVEGDLVRLEPLGVHHVPGLLKEAAQDPSLYQWVLVPQDEPAMRRHVEDALAARAKGIAVPFAVVRLADETVIGSTRFHQLDYWARPEPANVPDTCEIGYSWLAREALRTGANTEMKRLMLTHAFEVWRVRSVCLHTDVRNQRSQNAIRRIGGRSRASCAPTAWPWTRVPGLGPVQHHARPNGPLSGSLADLAARYAEVLSGARPPGSILGRVSEPG